MRTYRHAAILGAMLAVGASPAMVRAAEEEAGIPPLEPEPKPDPHQHKREIARRLRQKARAEVKRAARERGL